MIGFASEVVNVEEDGGNAVLTVLLAVSLQRNVAVTFETSSGTAKGKKYRYSHASVNFLYFTHTTLTVQSISAC